MRFTKKEIEVLQSALSMSAYEIDQALLQHTKPDEVYNVCHSAMMKLKDYGRREKENCD